MKLLFFALLCRADCGGEPGCKAVVLTPDTKVLSLYQFCVRLSRQYLGRKAISSKEVINVLLGPR